MDNKVNLIDKKTVYDGFFKTKLYTVSHRLFSGDMSSAINRECFERFHAVGVLAFDPIRDKIVFIEQFRIGAWVDKQNSSNDASDESGWIYEIIAGIIDPNQTPESVALREAEEEAGCDILALVPIHKYYTSPGGASETLQLYCGAIDSENIGGLYGLEHEGEDIRAFTLDYSEAVTWLAEGKLNNASTIICMQWLMLNHKQIKDKWKNCFIVEDSL